MKQTTPEGDLTIRTVAMPADTNTSGDIFGGWVLSQMDIASGIHAAEYSKTRVVTVGIEAMRFCKPVHVGDILSAYCAVERVGNTSVSVKVEAWVQRQMNDRLQKVTEGVFTFVALDEGGQKIKVPQS